MVVMVAEVGGGGSGGAVTFIGRPSGKWEKTTGCYHSVNTQYRHQQFGGGGMIVSVVVIIIYVVVLGLVQGQKALILIYPRYRVVGPD